MALAITRDAEYTCSVPGLDIMESEVGGGYASKLKEAAVGI